MTRVVGGLAGGRRLAVPPAGTRPTSDRAREGLFNTLATDLDLSGARVLDLYAGSGALGLEALSRGAAVAVFVESDRRAAEVLRRNVRTVGLPGASVVTATVARALDRGPAAHGDAPFDLVLLDPPYALGNAELQRVLGTLAGGGWLAERATVVVERSARDEPFDWPADPVASITPVREKRYGEAVLWYGRAR